MQLAEYWPYALVLVSGAALIVVLLQIFRRPAPPRRRPQPRRKPAAVGGQPRRFSATAPRGEVRPDPAERATPVRQAPPPVMPRVMVAEEDSIRPFEPVHRGAAASAPRRDGFAAAAQAVARAAPQEDQDFEIPSFLKRDGEAIPVLPPAPELQPVGEGKRLESGLGRLVYAPPRRLRQLVASRVTVRIERDGEAVLARSAAMPRLWTAEPARAEPPADLPIGVQLVAGTGSFRIETKSPLLQLIEGADGAAEWTFEVTPLSTGRATLTLVVAACRVAGGRVEVQAEERIAAPLRIAANGRRLVRQTGKIAAGMLAVALATWLATMHADTLRSAVSASSGATAPQIVAPGGKGN